MRMEVAYSVSGYVRIFQIGPSYFELQALSIRGQSKLGTHLFWKKVCGTFNRDKAIKLLEIYAR